MFTVLEADVTALVYFLPNILVLEDIVELITTGVDLCLRIKVRDPKSDFAPVRVSKFEAELNGLGLADRGLRMFLRNVGGVNEDRRIVSDGEETAMVVVVVFLPVMGWGHGDYGTDEGGGGGTAERTSNIESLPVDRGGERQAEVSKWITIELDREIETQKNTCSHPHNYY